jgi:pilus assembly protein CpaC
LKELGVSLSGKTGKGNLFNQSGKGGIGDFILGSGASSANAFVTGTLGLVLGDLTISALFDALETKGFSRTLAEPTLVALSGDMASFLAGGEFPYQTTDEEGVTNIEFKEFGISLEFTPTVLDRNRINLVVKPEVSTLDFDLIARAGVGLANLPEGSTVTTSGTPQPALSTRRATTTVELGDGQSFAIAGLISNEFDDSLSQVPWVANVPVLGALMRSSDFRRLETELVMVVTPYIVKPLNPGQVTLPTDRFMPPSEKDLFLMGNIREQVNTVAPVSGPGGRIKGGIAGAHGHIVE